MFGPLESIMGAVNDPFGTRAIDKGLQSQADATDQANRKLDEVYNQQRSDLEPWMKAGTTSLSQMQNPDFQRDFSASDFQKDPGYDFRMQEGQKAIERSAAARGSVQSGATLKALTKYGQDFASNEYNNAYNRFNADRDRRFGRLSGIAGMGQNATGMGVNAAGNYGSMYSNNLTNMGNAAAAGGMAKANANQQLLKLGATAAGGAAGGM